MIAGTPAHGLDEAHPAPVRHGVLMRAIRRFSLATGLLAVMAFGVADGKPLLLLLGLIVGFASWLMTRGAPVEPVRVVPRLALNLLVGASAAYLLLALLGSRQDSVVSSLTDFLCLVLLIKMLDRASMRDEAQVLTLAVFVVIGAVLSGAQLALGIVLVLFTPLVIASIITWQVCAGQERLALRAASLNAGPVRTGVDAGPARVRRNLAYLVLCAVVLALGSGVAAFILTPRSFAQGMAGQWGRPMPGAVAGFTDQIRLGQAGLLSQSTTPVGEVTLLNAAGEPTGAADQPVYLRGATLDRYNPASGQWSSATPADAVRDVPERGRGQRATGDNQRLRLADESASPSVSRTVVTQRIALRAVGAGEAPLFGALYPVAVTIPGSREGVRVNRMDGTFSRRTGAGGPLTYTVESRPDFVMPESEVARLHGLRDRARVAPEFKDEWADPFAAGPVRELAERLIAGLDVPLDPAVREPFQVRRAATAFMTHLRQFEYTLEMVAPAPGEDPLSMFLFTTQRGHCAYFAAAMVALCQSIGIEARIVTGYVSGEYNSIAGHYIVRESDAHAWVELATRPGRWEAFDPTPPASLQHAQRASTGVLAWLREIYDALEFSWVQNVIAFDSAKRSELVSFDPNLSNPETLYAARRWFSDVSAWVRRLLPSGMLGDALSVAALIMVCAGFCGLGFIAVRALVRRLRPRAGAGAPDYTRPPPELAALLTFYPRMLESLDAHGRAKPSDVPPMAFAEGLEPIDPRLAGLVRTVADRYYRVRFGGAPPESPDEAAEHALQVLQTHLASLARVR